MRTVPFAHLVAIVGLNVADIGTTIIAISRETVSVEVNPIMRFLFHTSPLVGFSLKMIAISLIIVWMSTHFKKQPKAFKLLSQIIIVIVSFVVLSNGLYLVT